jgi:hypothetical protein
MSTSLYHLLLHRIFRDLQRRGTGATPSPCTGTTVKLCCFFAFSGTGRQKIWLKSFYATESSIFSSALTTLIPPSFLSSHSKVDSFRCGIEKLIPMKVRQAFVARLVRLLPAGGLMLSSNLRFFAIGLETGGLNRFRTLLAAVRATSIGQQQLRQQQQEHTYIEFCALRSLLLIPLILCRLCFLGEREREPSSLRVRSLKNSLLPMVHNSLHLDGLGMRGCACPPPRPMGTGAIQRLAAFGPILGLR